MASKASGQHHAEFAANENSAETTFPRCRTERAAQGEAAGQAPQAAGARRGVAGACSAHAAMLAQQRRQPQAEAAAVVARVGAGILAQLCAIHRLAKRG